MTSVEPREVHSNGRVVVGGHGFGALPGEVAFGGDTAGPIYRWTDTEIEVDVPSGAPRGAIAVEVRFPRPKDWPSSPPYHPMPGEATPEPTPTPAPTPGPWVARGGEIYVRNYLLPGKEGSFVPSDVIFGIREGEDPEEIAWRHCIEGVRPISDASFPYYIGHVPTGREAETILALAADPGVTSANPNGIMHAT